jgi:hypothetical protein
LLQTGDAVGVAGAAGEFHGAASIETVARACRKPVARPTPTVWRYASMTRGSLKAIGVAVSTAALVVAVGVGGVIAGEVTGSGKKITRTRAARGVPSPA